jgi:hypothetical protein
VYGLDWLAARVVAAAAYAREEVRFRASTYVEKPPLAPRRSRWTPPVISRVGSRFSRRCNNGFSRAGAMRRHGAPRRPRTVDRGVLDMRRLGFLPLTTTARDGGGPRVAPAEVDEAPGADQTYALATCGDGSLVVLPLAGEGLPGEGGDSNARMVAILRAAGSSADRAWCLIARDGHLAVNGLCPPLPLMRLDPGAIVSLGRHCWLVTTVWAPKPDAAPADLADKPCPVCGGPLRLAPVVQCVCGRWTHLERPDEPRSPDALNCYLVSGACGACGRSATLEPQISPEPPQKLLPARAEDLIPG